VVVALQAEPAQVAVEQVGRDIAHPPGPRDGGLLPVPREKPLEQGDELVVKGKEERAGVDARQGCGGGRGLVSLEGTHDLVQGFRNGSMVRADHFTRRCKTAA
jgi:hypothetical protein